MPIIKLDDLNLHYEIEGTGPPLLMITGTGFPGAAWRTGVSQRFAGGGFRVITYDHRGVGKSDCPDGAYSTRLFARDAVALLDALGIEKAHVLGHSMGGRVAQWMALDNGRVVRSLVLAASGPGAFDPEFEVTRGVPLYTAEGLVRAGYEQYMRRHIAGPFFFTPDFAAERPEVVQGLADAFWENRPSLRAYLHHVVARQQHQTAERLHEITAPTLVVVGDDDSFRGGTGNHLQQSRFLAEQLPNAEMTVIQGAAHAFFWQNAAEASATTTAAIVSFLRSN